MGSAFHQLCPRYSGTLTPTAPTAIRLWETFIFFSVSLNPWVQQCAMRAVSSNRQMDFIDLDKFYVLI